MKSNFDFETLIDQHSRLLWSISSGILGEYAAKAVIEDLPVGCICQSFIRSPGNILMRREEV
ncbi:MAG: hypothetical protein ACLRT5_10590 [Lachnospiraceae bacterium]